LTLNLNFDDPASSDVKIMDVLESEGNFVCVQFSYYRPGMKRPDMGSTIVYLKLDNQNLLERDPQLLLTDTIESKSESKSSLLIEVVDEKSSDEAVPKRRKTAHFFPSLNNEMQQTHEEESLTEDAKSTNTPEFNIF
jgi:hypothetical protein